MQKAGADYFTGVNGNDSGTAIRMTQEMMTSTNANHLKPGPLAIRAQTLCRWAGERCSCGNGHALDANEFQIGRVFVPHFQAECYRFANSHHDFIERLRLSVATRKLRNRGDVITVRIPFYNYVELACIWKP